MARGYKSQSKGGSDAGGVGDDGDNGDVEAMTIVMAIVMMMIMVMVKASPSTSRPVQWVVWEYKRQ